MSQKVGQHLPYFHFIYVTKFLNSMIVMNQFLKNITIKQRRETDQDNSLDLFFISNCQVTVSIIVDLGLFI